MAKHIAPLGQTMGQLCVWLQACRSDRAGEREGFCFFYQHIGPMGRGVKRLGWFFLVNMAARRDGGCSSGAVGLYKTLSLMKLVRRRCSMFWGWLPTTQTPPAPALKTALVFTNISSRWDRKGVSECVSD